MRKLFFQFKFLKIHSTDSIESVFFGLEFFVRDFLRSSCRGWLVILCASLSMLGCSLMNSSGSETSSAPRGGLRSQEASATGGEGAKVRSGSGKSTEGMGGGIALKQRLLVLPFLDSNPEHPSSFREAARKDFMLELIRTKQVVVVDSNDLNLPLEDTIKKGEYNVEALAPQIAKLGIPAFFEGRILQLKVARSADEVGLFRTVKSTFSAQIRVRILSSRSARELFATTRTVSIQESGLRVGENQTVAQMLADDPGPLQKLVAEAFMDFFPQIRSTLEKLSWEGRIAAVQGERFFLNVGEASGLKVGDLLKVSEEGEDVFDPQTGHFIGKSQGRVKGTLEVVEFFGKDGSVSVIHSGSGFKENDKIELY